MLDEARLIVLNSPPDDYKEGIFARFKKIDDQWGLKIYDNDERMRDHCYKFQKLAFDIGCAPALGEKFALDTPKGKVYGFITECVVSMGSDTDSWGKYKFEDEMEGEPEYDELIEKLQEIMSVDDMHGGNVGYLPNGKMVAIDFSHCKRKSW